jgi:VWFA-related protein
MNRIVPTGRGAALWMSAVSGLVFTTAAAAQAPPETFSEVLDVRVVNLEVVVTDRDGVPVRGLRASDFVLEVDGEAVDIDYFSEVQGGRALSAEGDGATTLPAIPAVVAGEPVGTSYLVFVDDYFTFEDDRNRVLDGIEADLPLLGPRDRMAIVAFDGHGLDMLSSWSQSASELGRALAKARQRHADGLMRLAELRQYEGGAQLPRRFVARGVELDAETKAYVLRLSDQVDRAIDAAAATLRSFAKPPGRKVMVLVTGGWPYSATEFVNADLMRSAQLDLVEGDELFSQLSDTANLLGYTLYPADASGLGSRWNEDPGSASRVVPGSLDLQLARRATRQFSTRFLARETGGEPLLFDRANRALNEVVADTRSYYWLGFTPDRGWDDAAHDVHIRTRGGELEVRSRRGYLDSSRSTEVTMSVESAFLFGGLPEAPQLSVALGAWEKSGFRKMEVPLTISLPMSEITFLPARDGVAADLELRIAVEDEGQSRADIPVVPIHLEGSAPPTAGEMFQYTVPLRLRRQKHRALVALYDVTSGRIYSAGVEIEP